LTESREDKKARIMEAAISVFSRKGFPGATMDDVASEAGLGKGTLYLYFPSKEDLLKEILAGGLHILRKRLQEIADDTGSARERLEAMAHLELELICTNRDLVQFIVDGVGGLGEAFRGILMRSKREMIETVSGVVEDGIRRGEFGPVDVDIFSKAFLGSIWSVASSVLEENPDFEPVEAARGIVEVFMSGAAKEPPRYDQRQED